MGAFSVNTTKGNLYIWGKYYGKAPTAVGSSKIVFTKPILVEKQVVVKDFISGARNYAFVSNDGQAWFWASNSGGRYGNGEASEVEDTKMKDILHPQQSLWNYYN